MNPEMNVIATKPILNRKLNNAHAGRTSLGPTTSVSRATIKPI